MLRIAPAANWVKPSRLPETPALSQLSPQLSPQAAPIRQILNDQQVWFHGDTTSLFTRRAMRVLSPDGLAALTRVAVEWKPESDRVTIHSLTIHRAGQQINVLALGTPGNLVRRRPGAEQSRIDGTVAASLPVIGLQVGDVVDLAYTIDRTEPLLRGHHDLTLDAATQEATDRVVIAAKWDKARPAAFTARHLPAPMHQDAGRVVLLADQLTPLPLPQGAPERYRRGREVTFSDYRSWADVAAIFTPLFNEARQIAPNSPLQAEIARIKAASPDPAIRAALAQSLAEDDVRYLYVGLAQGNLRPASADQTWQRRFGDCKGKVALLLALLDGLAIPAEAAMVSATQGDGLAERLPNLSQFDHVIVRASINGRNYWLDPTRNGDTNLAALPVPQFHWALPLTAPLTTKTAGLEAITVPAPLAPTMVHDLRLDASRGISLPALARASMVLSSDIARTTHAMLERIPTAKLNEALSAVWQKQYPLLTAKTLSQDWDEASQTLRLTLDGTAQIDWHSDAATPFYTMSRATLGNPDEFTRAPGPEAEAPFALPWPDFTEQRETLILPGKAEAFRISGENINTTLANRALLRRIERHGNIITMLAHTRPLAPELPYEAAQAAAAPLRQLANTPVTITVNRRAYVQTPEEVHMAKANPNPEPHIQPSQVALAR